MKAGSLTAILWELKHGSMWTVLDEVLHSFDWLIGDYMWRSRLCNWLHYDD